MTRKSILVKLVGVLARTFYRINRSGLDHLPNGGFLLLPNHVTWVDAIILQTACPRPIRFLIYGPIYRNPVLNPLFRLLKAIPISSHRAKEGMKQAAERIRAGEIVCVFPEGELSRNGMLLRLRRGYELIAHSAECPVIPVWLDQLWGSIFSFEGNKYFKKLPKCIPYPVTVSFGEPIPHDHAGIATVRERLLLLGEAAFQERPLLNGHLAMACLRGLKHRQFDTLICDGMDNSQMTRGTLLAAATVLARYLVRHCPNKRIAILLPPGRAAVVANLAIMLARKVPVNMNFTAGHAAQEAAIRIAELEDIITAGPVLKKFPAFPLPPNVLRIEEILPPLKKKIALWRGIVAITPWRLLAKILRIPHHGGHEEAVVLFTSGTAGEPKGVVLSHRNILGNVSQFGQMLSLKRSDAILACLPFFHSFGCTVTLWFPLIEGIRMVTYPNPLDVEKNAELIHRHRITLLLSTPTFLRAYLRRATREQLGSVELLVTGAEKLPRDLADSFEAKFGIAVLEGYGLTETAPVASVNLPEPPKGKPDDQVQPSSRPGSTGKLAPGVAAQIRDPETGKPLSLHETGMLWLRGPNIFEGYLGDPKRTAEVLQDGWFKTGDLGRFDEDGFLYIEGRISRFSKIAGEMIPHELLEVKIRDALDAENEHEHERTVCIVGIPDAARGEALILLSTHEIDLPTLRPKLLAAGVPVLWIPKVVKLVSHIPVLGSGKLDLKACRELAEG
jgi:acyl-[acyl-carrier-protein]-phospholipid O-acyltransferase/long-chain-fatty-acid--[acyl-carrier-protein] ligase